MQRNSVLLENLTVEQLEQLLEKSVKKEIQQLQKDLQPKQPNEYLTRQQVATMLGVDLSTLHNWNKKKVLSPIGIAGRVYYLRSEVEASLKPLNV